MKNREIRKEYKLAPQDFQNLVIYLKCAGLVRKGREVVGSYNDEESALIIKAIAYSRSCSKAEACGRAVMDIYGKDSHAYATYVYRLKDLRERKSSESRGITKEEHRKEAIAFLEAGPSPSAIRESKYFASLFEEMTAQHAVVYTAVIDEIMNNLREQLEKTRYPELDLINAVIGSQHSQDICSHDFEEHLLEFMHVNEPSGDLDSYVSKATEYLMSLYAPGDNQTSLQTSIAEMLSKISPRRARVLRLRFGLDGERKRTLEETGKEFGVGKERARCIEADALRIIRKYHFEDIYKMLEDVREAHIRTYSKKGSDARFLYQSLETYRQRMHAMQEELDYLRQSKPFEDSSIRELGLSHRILNSLVRARIETIRDILELGEEGLLKRKSLGKLSLQQIREKLGEHGISFQSKEGNIGDIKEYEQN